MGSHSASAGGAEGSFSALPSKHVYSGFLFDLDGTIVDSTEAIEKCWRMLAKELEFDAEVLLATSHGRRSIDTLRIVAPEKANWEYISQLESRLPIELGASAKEIPGARDILSQLTAISAPWGIVTSGTNALMSGWLKAMSLPAPPISVTAEEVQDGKPDPACYNLGRERIGLEVPKLTGVSDDVRVLVVEDAPSGIRAGKAAGCSVLGLATTHSIESVISAGADWVVKDLSCMRVVGTEGTGKGLKIEIEISDGWISTDDRVAVA